MAQAAAAAVTGCKLEEEEKREEAAAAAEERPLEIQTDVISFSGERRTELNTSPPTHPPRTGSNPERVADQSSIRRFRLPSPESEERSELRVPPFLK